MPRHASVNLAETFAKILCERASFELKEDDVNAYRQHINSLQQAAQVTAAARAQEEEEYRHWKVCNHTASLIFISQKFHAMQQIGSDLNMHVRRTAVDCLSCRALCEGRTSG